MNSDGNIRENIVKALAFFLMGKEDTEEEIDNVYRLNSRFSTTRNVPKNALVYFNGKKVRDQVLQQYFVT